MRLPGSPRNAAVGLLVAVVLVTGCGSRTAHGLLASAKEHVSKSDPNTAIVELRNALQKNPALAEARYLLGKILLENGKARMAETELRRALELKYPADQVLPSLARTLLALGKFKQLTTEFGGPMSADADVRAELQTIVGQAHLATGEPSAAEEAFATALVAKPGFGPALFGQVSVAAAKGELATALERAEYALAISPNYADGWRLKGNILSAQGQSESALVAYRKAVELAPSHLLARSAVVFQFVQQRRFDSAANELRAMRQVAPNHPQTFFLHALLAYEQNDLIGAREAVQQQIKVAPDDLRGMLLAGAVEYRLEAYAQAESHILKVLQRAPDSRPARQILIATYLRSGQVSRALDVLKPILHSIGNDSDMLALAGELLLRNHEPREAATYFAKSSTLDPSDTQKRTALALSYIATGQTEKGIRELERTAERDSGVRANVALISAYLQQREYEKALWAVDALEARRPNDPLTQTIRGGLLQARGDLSAARKSFEQASVMDPTFVAAAVGLARLDVWEAKPKNGLGRFQAVLEKDPGNLPALLTLAEVRAKTGAGSTEVATLIRRAIVANPTAPEGRLALIEHYVRAGDRTNALDAAQEAMASLPYRPEILEATAGAQLMAGQTNQALMTYRRLSSLLPNSPLPYLRMADLQLRAGDKDGALQSLGKVLELRPESIAAFLESGGGQRIGTNAAANAQRTALPENVRILNNIAWAAGKLKDPRAVEYAEKAHALAPNEPAIMDTLGTLLVERGHVTRGLELLQKAAQLEPNAEEIRLSLAKGLLKAGRFDQAKRAELEDPAKFDRRLPEAHLATSGDNH